MKEIFEIAIGKLPRLGMCEMMAEMTDDYNTMRHCRLYQQLPNRDSDGAATIDLLL